MWGEEKRVSGDEGSEATEGETRAEGGSFSIEKI